MIVIVALHSLVIIVIIALLLQSRLCFHRNKNTIDPKNKYLEAIYHCIKGHVFENPSHTKLYCSNGHWVGVKPLCVPKTTPMTVSNILYYYNSGITTKIIFNYDEIIDVPNGMLY